MSDVEDDFMCEEEEDYGLVNAILFILCIIYIVEYFGVFPRIFITLIFFRAHCYICNG